MTPDEIENHVFRRAWRGYDRSEVDDFLKGVAAAQAEPPSGPTDPVTDVGHDDFERLGEGVAAVLRQIHESMATLRHQAEADAALLRQNAEGEADLLRQAAESDRQAAALALEAAQAESARVLTAIQRQADLATEQAAALARQRAREIIEGARLEARDAVTVQRDVRGRLEGTRHDIDQALDRLVADDEDLFATIDLTPIALGPGPGLAPPPRREGPPTAPVTIRTTPVTIEELPYTEDDVAGGEEQPNLSPVVDLTDRDAGPGAGDDDWLTAFEDAHPT
ncbi:MAG: DivIVA domain-containing protein [Acidimicrobiales bacterium]